MNDRDAELNGQLVAIRTMLAMIIAKIAVDESDAELPDRLHEWVTRLVESSVAATRAKMPHDEAAAALRLQGSAIELLDSTFAIAKMLARKGVGK